MSDDSVHAPEVHASSPNRALFVALPLITLSWLIILIVLVTALVPIQRYELAPGDASTVAERIAFSAEKGKSAPRRYPTKNSIRFVTAQTGQLTIFTSLMAWLDPHVTVHTYTEHFGSETPSSIRRLGYQAMVGAKQIAEYVAVKTLGGDAKINEGKVLIEQTICLQNPSPKSACKVLDVGEVITAVNGVPTPTLTALSEQLKNRTIGEAVTLTVLPYTTNDKASEEPQQRTVTLMESPDVKGKAIIGFTPADTRTVTLPFDVNISTADIGGPSAGLAFTLAIIDELSPGNLMGSQKVAATGTMNEAGQVGAIGALEQKAVAVRDSGARLFLVPAGQSPEEVAKAQKAAGNSVKIVQVATLKDALRVLAKYGGGKIPTAPANATK